MPVNKQPLKKSGKRPGNATDTRTRAKSLAGKNGIWVAVDEKETSIAIGDVVTITKEKPQKPALVVTSDPSIRQQIMAEQREILLTKTLPTLRRKYGPTAIQWLVDVPVMPRISTGIGRMDDTMCGGMEVGGIVEIFGLDQSGKTSLALQIAGMHDSVVYIDGERKISLDTAKRFGVHGNFLVVQPESLEEAFELARHFLKAGISLVVIDSLPSLPSMKEVDENDFDKITGISPTAGLLARKLSVLNNICHRMQSTLLVVNQQRDNTNMKNPFGERYHTFGGHQLRSLAKLRIHCARSKFIKVEEKHGSKIIKREIGQVLAFQIAKSSFCPPREIGEIPLVFADGFTGDDVLTADVILEDDVRFRVDAVVEEPIYESDGSE